MTAPPTNQVSVRSVGHAPPRQPAEPSSSPIGRSHADLFCSVSSGAEREREVSDIIRVSLSPSLREIKFAKQRYRINPSFVISPAVSVMCQALAASSVGLGEHE